MSHLCHAPGCEQPVPPKLFVCSTHWYSLSKRVRDAVWREYREGQEITKSPTMRYVVVQTYACALLALDSVDAKAKALGPILLSRAERWRRRCVKLGLGDPLRGILPEMRR